MVLEISQKVSAELSSSGLGCNPFKVDTPVQIRVALPNSRKEMTETPYTRFQKWLEQHQEIANLLSIPLLIVFCIVEPLIALYNFFAVKFDWKVIE